MLLAEVLYVGDVSTVVLTCDQQPFLLDPGLLLIDVADELVEVLDEVVMGLVKEYKIEQMWLLFMALKS